MALKADKQEKVIQALKSAPHGMWVREIARKSGIDKSTCSRYLEKMGSEVEFEFWGRNKIFRLKNLNS
ncbi:MAG TPA: helix-turn-helix domain-containing protein [archaeon]|nr:helix-turn-helix domain-containing protein [archaeon]